MKISWSKAFKVQGNSTWKKGHNTLIPNSPQEYFHCEILWGGNLVSKPDKEIFPLKLPSQNKFWVTN